jgi:hypothetical protein
MSWVVCLFYFRNSDDKHVSLTMLLPARVGKYQLEEYLGGGMAEVYRAVDCVLHRTVAFKVLSAQGAADASMRQRFLAEARLGSQVNHPHIVRTLDYAEDGDAPFLVLEFLQGRSLTRLIKENTGGSIQNRTRIALESAQALEHVHSLGILHRDIKPDNIHVDEKDCARLIDFGIAKSSDMNMTQPGMVIGTPYYMPPEQIRGEAANVRTDIYSFGLVLFELYSGIRARKGDTMQRLFEEILNKPVSFEALAEANVPLELRQIVESCAAHDPAQRPETFTEVARRLQQWLKANPENEPAHETAPSRNSFLRGRLSWALAGVAICLAAVAGGAGFSRFTASSASDAGAGASLVHTEVAKLPNGILVDRFEVTNEFYKSFAHRTGRQLPVGFVTDSPGSPVVNVSAWDAEAFCKWAGKRLPTESEWIQAAGGDQRKFPWGQQADPARANVADNPDMAKQQHLVSADSLKDGASPLGVLHLAGNAAEWVADRRAPSFMAVKDFAKLIKPPPSDTEEWRVIKGGSYLRPLAEGSIREWMPAPSRFTAADVGFRCACQP